MRAPMSLRRYLASLFAAALLALLAVGAMNALVDPFWFFAHENRWNACQAAFDERQQKTNRVSFQPLDVEAVVLGTSRTAYIDADDFAPLATFNYGLAGLWPEEYREYLAHAKAHSARPITTVFLGVDFAAGPKRVFGPGQQAPSRYIETASDPFYRLRTLFSFDTWSRSRVNATMSCDEPSERERYDRHYRKLAPVRSEWEGARALVRTLRGYQDHVIVPGLRYDGSDRAAFEQLRAAFPDVHFVVFVTPLSPWLFSLIVAQGKLPDYEAWLADLVDVFGSVYDFTGPSSITRDPANFYDATHFTIEVGRLVAHRLVGRRDPALPDDFGVVLDRAALPARVAKLRADAALADPDPIGTAEKRLAEESGPTGEPPTASLGP